MAELDPGVGEAIREHTDTLTAYLGRELQALKQIQDTKEQARLAKAEEAAKAAKAGDAKLEFLLEQQAAADKARADRRSFLVRFVAGPSGVLAVIAGAVVAYLQATAPDKPPEVKPADVQRTVEQRVEQLERRQNVQIRRVDRLGDLHYETLDVIVESRDEHNKKLDAIADKLRVREVDEIEEADAVSEAREEVKAYKDRKRREGEPARVKGDPFADLPDLPQNARAGAD